MEIINQAERILTYPSDITRMDGERPTNASSVVTEKAGNDVSDLASFDILRGDLLALKVARLVFSKGDLLRGALQF